MDAKRLGGGVAAGAEAPVKIAYLGDLAFHAQREKYGGVLRYAAKKPDWIVRQFDLAALEGGRGGRLARWSPDAFIAGNHHFLDPPGRGRGAKRRLLVAVDVLENMARQARADGVVAPDDAEIAAAPARMFLRRGFRSFAYVGYAGHERSALRETMFRKALAEAGFGCAAFEVPKDELPSEPEERHRAGPKEKLEGFLASLPRPCAVFAYWDVLAKDVLDSCRMAHLRVPEQFFVLGVDDDAALCERTRPTLSSVAPDFDDAGWQAAAMLDGLLRGGSRGSAAPPVRRYGIRGVTERQSTQDFRGCARLVAAAKEMIRREACTGLRPASLAERFRVSERTLQLRFAEVLGRTPGEEILRAKLDAVRRLLRTTGMPLSDVAGRCGFEEHRLRVVFKERFGCSMRQWRARNRS